MVFKNENGGTPLSVVAPVGLEFKLGQIKYRVVGQTGSMALVENQNSGMVKQIPLERFAGNAGWMWAGMQNGKWVQ